MVLLGLSLECPICLEHFDDASKTPRLLPCGHTFCQFCIERLILSCSASLLRHLQCPQCRALFKWRGIQELPKNYIILREPNPRSAAIDSTRNICMHVLHFPLVTLTGTSFMKRVLKQRLWELARVVAASYVLFILVPISLLHLCFSWWTAILGLLVFFSFSVGVAGIAVFLLFLWWTRSLLRLLYRFAKFVLQAGDSRTRVEVKLTLD